MVEFYSLYFLSNIVSLFRILTLYRGKILNGQYEWLKKYICLKKTGKLVFYLLLIIGLFHVSFSPRNESNPTFTFPQLTILFLKYSEDKKAPTIKMLYEKYCDYFEEFDGDGIRVAIYIRVSSIQQFIKGRSMDTQKDKGERMIDKNKPSLVAWNNDGGKSGKQFDNRKIMNIKYLAENKLIDELWLIYIDRLGRNLLESLKLLICLWENGVLIRTPEKLYKYDNLADVVMLIIRFFISEDSNNQRAEKSQSSKHINFIEGKWNNNSKPFGYIINQHKIVKNEKYAELIKDVYKVFLEYRNISAVRKLINRRYKSILSVELTDDIIEKILRDPIYMGKPYYSKNRQDIIRNDPQLAFIDESLYHECYVLLPKKKPPKKRKILEKPLKKHGTKLIDFLKEITWNHKECGGEFVKNGTRILKGVEQENLKCNKCGKQYWVLNETQLTKLNKYISNKMEFLNPLKTILYSKLKSLRKRVTKRKHNKSDSYRYTKLDEFFKKTY